MRARSLYPRGVPGRVARAYRPTRSRSPDPDLDPRPGAVAVSADHRPTQPGRLGIRALTRGARKRCPNCGGGDLFRTYFTIRERCPSCGLAFEREEGYWLGAMIVAIGVTEALFGLWFVGGMLVTWPDVPWTMFLVGGLLLNLVVPVVGYPWSMTTWMGLHMAFVPPEPAEEAAAIAALDADRRARAIAARDAGRSQAAQDTAPQQDQEPDDGEAATRDPDGRRDPEGPDGPDGRREPRDPDGPDGGAAPRHR